MKIDVADNRAMFFKAYDYLKEKYPDEFPTTVEKATAIWFKEFNIVMITNAAGLFTEAEFDNEADASVFILKWS